ncbi:hypothetical protein [Streptomyces boncukensis]|uniref:Fido domain-containing protein n=1 Tax=Streptomyces boncukensis TaxID=2711219 RepID=A0A6G4XAX9_9ACTN|nr:hypothetical protein [Streptomyces boncukensis]NGO73811.1 hypothetical protein [Streptomyces boncukensis]
MYDRQLSPGFRQGMTEAYELFLDQQDGVAHRMDARSYLALHTTATRYLPHKPGWSGGQPTSFPLRAKEPSEDLLQETLGGRPLATRLDADYWAKGTDERGERPITFVDMQEDPTLTGANKKEPLLRTNYGTGEVPEFVDHAFDRYYEQVKGARTERDKLAAIGQIIRTLQVTHPFHDANRRINVHGLLHKFLLEQGFKPIVTDKLASLFQGSYSVPQMTDILAKEVGVE